jgi:hypothetical protein
MTITRKKILGAVLAASVGLSLALPLRAAADDGDHERDRQHHMWSHDDDDSYRANHQYWRHDEDGDYYRAFPYRHDDDDNYRIYPHGIGLNGDGMINRRNPNFYWACDANGHHCHWAWRR